MKHEGPPQKKDGYPQQTREHASMWQNLRQSEAWRNGTSFGLNNNHETLVHVARQAKEWVSAHVLKR